MPAINAHGRHPQAVPASRAMQPALLVSLRQRPLGWFDAVESPVILATRQVGEPARSFLSRLAARPCHQSIRRVVIVSESSPRSVLQQESRDGQTFLSHSCPQAATALKLVDGVLGGQRAPRARAAPACKESMARTAGRADRGPRGRAARNRLGCFRNPGQDRPGSS